MARQILPIIGATVGAFIGGPAGAQAGFVIGTLVGNAVDPLVIQGNKIGDNQLQTASEGGARAIVFGQGQVSATCLIARGNRQVVKKKEGGGKGGPKTETESVYWTFAIGLGEAIVGGAITRVWQDENLVYDVRPDGQVSGEDNAAFAGKFRFYDGSETQLPDPALQVFLDDDTPYFRGTAYVVFQDFDLTNTAERIPIFSFEVNAPSVGYWADFATVDWPAPSGLPVNSDSSPVVTGDAAAVLRISRRSAPYLAWSPYANDADNGGNTWYGGSFSLVGVDGLIWTSALRATQEEAYADFSESSLILTGLTSYVFRMSDPNPSDDRGGMSLRVERFYGNYGEYDPEETKISLGLIVDKLLGRVGMAGQTSELDDMVTGVVIQETMTGADAISSILSSYFADPAEYDGQLHFVKRGKPVLRVLTIDDLVEEPDVSSRENVIEYPTKLHFFFQSPKTGYATTKVTSNRYSSNSDVVGEGSVTVPVTFDDSDEPANIASKLHKVMWAEAGGDFSWVVGDHCLDLVPTDVVGLSLRGVVNRARITATATDQGKIKLTMRKDRQSAYTANVQALPLSEPTPPQPTAVSLAVLAVLDIPALVDADDILCYYTAMSGSTSAWRGGQVQRSLDDGATWGSIGEASVDAPMGRLTAAMTAASPHYPDTHNIVSVQLFDPANQIESLTDQQWLSEQGALAIEAADGSWEIVQYRDATDEGDGLYTLSMLQRGRLNTPAVAHAEAALVVVLDVTLQRQAAQSSWLASSLSHRGVSYGTSAETADVEEATYTGKSQREWPVASFNALIAGSTVVVSNIVPRHRFGTEDAPVRSTNWSGYRIVCSDGTYSVTVDTVNTSATISTTSIGTVTSVSVYQLNRITGAGEVLSIAPEVVPPLPQVYTITLGGTFDEGVGLRAILGAETFNYTTITGDASLEGAATSLAAVIDASSVYSASATGAQVFASGPNSVPYSAQALIPGSGTGAMFAGLMHTAAPAVAATSYYAQLILYNIASGNTELIPAGTSFTVNVYRPIGTLIGSVSCTTAFAQNANGVHLDIRDAFNASLLAAQGYNYGATFLGEQPIGTIVGPAGITQIYVETNASSPYQLGVSVQTPGSAEIPSPGRAQKIRVQIDAYSETPHPATEGALYRLTLGGVNFDYTALSGDDATDVVDALTALVNADTDYSAEDFGHAFEVTAAVANTPFTFSMQMIASTMTISGSITQTAR